MKGIEFNELRVMDFACEKALSHWSPESQMVALLEEMSELGVLIAKRVNRKHDNLSDFIFKISDEMADVYFLLRQMEYIFNNSEDVIQRISFKCGRLIERIREDK